MWIINKHPWADCGNCPLGEYTDNYCPSTGSPNAKYAVIGESPKRAEVKEQKNMVGGTGRLFDILLKHGEMDRDEVYLTNLVLCTSEGKVPPGAISSCSGRLEREIQAIEPEAIITLGANPSQHILQTDKKITGLRAGPPKVSAKYPNAKIIPTFHPASVIYNTGAFPDLANDFQKVKGVGEVPPEWLPPTYDVLNVAESHKYLQMLNLEQPRPLVMDIEVGIEKDVDFEHPERYEWLCVGLATSGKHGTVISEEAMQSSEIRRLLKIVLARHKVICHNGKFDLAGFGNYSQHTLYFDTMIASYVSDERPGIHSLEYNSIEKLGSPSWKDTVGQYLGPNKNYADIPRPILYKYNAYDICNTFRLYEYYRDTLTPELRKLHDFLCEASDLLRYPQSSGINIDPDYLDELTDWFSTKLADTKAKLQEIVGIDDYNPNSPKQVKEAIYNKWRRKLKNTQADTIIALQERSAKARNMDLYEFCILHLEYKSYSKSYGTYVKGMRIRMHKGKVHSTFRITKTVSGRLSSVNPNLQNITRGPQLRNLFIPAPGNILLQCDYGQAEFRVLATLAQDPYLQGIFKDPERSIHVETAKQFYGEDFNKARDKDKYIRAKAIVFGLLYGREAFSLAAEFKMSVDEAQKYINIFLGSIPATMDYINNDIMGRVAAGHDLVTPFGRRRRFWLITRQNKDKIMKEARAFMPQSTSSDINLAAGVEMKRQGLQDMLRIPIHDAWLAECKIEDKEEVGQLMAKIMSEVATERLGDFVPFPVDIEYGKSWGALA